MTVQPTFFISHGGPNIVTDDTPARAHLIDLPNTLPEKPSAIVIASAHFETDGSVVISDPSPGMIHDFRGFAPELYEMVYPAPGAPELAERIKQMLDEAGLSARLEEKRRYDLGAWTSMMLAFPAADIPIVQVSIDPNGDATFHHRLGATLEPLGRENVLIIGSGHITHNLRALFSEMHQGITIDPQMADKASAFTDWMTDNLRAGKRKACWTGKDKRHFQKTTIPPTNT